MKSASKVTVWKNRHEPTHTISGRLTVKDDGINVVVGRGEAAQFPRMNIIGWPICVTTDDGDTYHGEVIDYSVSISDVIYTVR